MRIPIEQEPKSSPIGDRAVLQQRSTSGKFDALPLSLPPRGLSRLGAATYLGVSPSLFDKMVEDGRMPKPKPINTRRIWDRVELDGAITALPHVDDAAEDNPWDGDE